MYKVTIDPGHGGSDPGTSYGNLIEKIIVLVVALKCRDELIRHGVEVQMTRTTDKYVELSQRAIMANSFGANYFVSIHCNAGGGDRGEVINSIYRGKGLELSNKISEQMKAIGQGAVKQYDKVGDNNKDYYAVIRESAMDAVIVECAFLDNVVDNKIIDTLAEQQAFGVAIAKGILAQLGILYKEETPKSLVEMHRNIVIYNDGAEADKWCAEFFKMILMNANEDCECVSYSEYRKSLIDGRSIFAVGGSLKDKFRYHKLFSGIGRNETAQSMLEHLKKY